MKKSTIPRISYSLRGFLEERIHRILTTLMNHIGLAIIPPVFCLILGPVLSIFPATISESILLGSALGIILTLCSAIMDQRILFESEIENITNAPIIGRIPFIKLKQIDSFATIVIENRYSYPLEKFWFLNSNIVLNPKNNAAKCILITSSIPNEGKTLLVSNLAATFSKLGEKVVIVDCDIRKPMCHRFFKQECTPGLIDVIFDKTPLIEGTVRLYENLDLIPSGGRSREPILLYHSEEFIKFISELKQTYDRILIDSPPVGLVSDSLFILPAVDGVIFNAAYNKVRRSTFRTAIARIEQSPPPLLGVVFNMTPSDSSIHYRLGHRYYRSYKKYYGAES